MFTHIARNRLVFNAVRNSFPQQRVLPVTYQVRLCSNEPAEKKETPSSAPYRGIPKYQVRPLDRFFLVATGAYKSMKDVPSEVEVSTITKAQNKRRIFVNIFLMVFCAIGSYIAFKRGKYLIQNKLVDNLAMQNLKRDEQNRAAAALERTQKAEAEKPEGEKFEAASKIPAE